METVFSSFRALLFISLLTSLYSFTPSNLSEPRIFSLKAASAIDDDRPVSVLVCPAQFCVPDDYDVLFDNLRELSGKDEIVKIANCRVAPLPRTEWIKVARQLPTKEFWQGNLNVPVTLQWYFDAIDKGISEILALDGPNARICLVGHSIGGWVARAWLGGLSESSTAVYRHGRPQISSLVTLGTPHQAPPADSLLAVADQTRGLLRAIENSEACKASELQSSGVKITNVISDGLPASLFTSNVEELVAAASYLPLTGSLSAPGDGIVPKSIAFMDTSSPENKSTTTQLVLTKCQRTSEPIRHSHVLPTPWKLWNGASPSIVLESPSRPFPSYVSKGVVEQWAQCIQ